MKHEYIQIVETKGNRSMIHDTKRKIDFHRRLVFVDLLFQLSTGSFWTNLKQPQLLASADILVRVAITTTRTKMS